MLGLFLSETSTENVALRQPTRQSSAVSNNEAEKAVDGGCCIYSTVTKKEDNPWWEVELQKMYNIETINIITSNQNALEDGANASGKPTITIGIANSTRGDPTNTLPNNYARCSVADPSNFQYIDQGVVGDHRRILLHCNADIGGRYVFVQINGCDSLELYEVEVYPFNPGSSVLSMPTISLSSAVITNFDNSETLKSSSVSRSTSRPCTPSIATSEYRPTSFGVSKTQVYSTISSRSLNDSTTKALKFSNSSSDPAASNTPIDQYRNTSSTPIASQMPVSKIGSSDSIPNSSMNLTNTLAGKLDTAISVPTQSASFSIVDISLDTTTASSRMSASSHTNDDVSISYEVSKVDGTSQTTDAVELSTTPKGSSIPFCQKPLTTPSYSVAEYYSDSNGSVAVFTCPPGHAFPDGSTSRTSVCVDGSWTKVSPCQRVNCLFGGNQETPDSMSFGEMQRSTCQSTNERFSDGTTEQVVKCTSTVYVDDLIMGQLNKQISKCSDKHCPPPPLVNNSNLHFDGEKRLVTFTCWSGYRFSDGTNVKTIECKDNEWDYSIGSCKETYCERLVPPLNSAIYSDTGVVMMMIYGLVLTVRCDLGFYFGDKSISKILQCQESGTWNDTLEAACEPVVCPQPHVIRNSTCESKPVDEGQSFPYGASRTCACLFDGMRFPDGRKEWIVTCGATGDWNATNSDSCDYGRCDPVPVFLHARPNSSLSLEGATVRYACDVGYCPSNDSLSKSEIFCDGISWTRQNITCIDIRCPVTDLFNGQVNTTSNLYGTYVMVSCLPGYVIGTNHTSSVVSCTDSGQWSASAVCQAIDCGPVPSILNAETKATVATTFGADATINCLRGYWFARDSSP